MIIAIAVIHSLWLRCIPLKDKLGGFLVTSSDAAEELEPIDAALDQIAPLVDLRVIVCTASGTGGISIGV